MKSAYLFLSGAILCFSQISFAQPGSLDGDFDVDGKVTTAYNGDMKGTSVALQADGKIIVVGTGLVFTSSHFGVILVRYFPDGTLDNAFGIGGIVDASDLLTNRTGYAISIQPDGRILFAGRNGDGLMLARLNTNGSFDTSFGVNGIVVTQINDIPSIYDIGFAIAIQPDGQILVAGYTENSSYDFFVARYNTDGSLDTSFSFDGIVVTDFGGWHDLARAIAVQPDGKILVTGFSFEDFDHDASDFATVRYHADGTLDLTFGTNGKVITNIIEPGFTAASIDEAYSMVLQPDGKILIAGSSEWGLFPEWFYSVVRYNPDGSLDTSFAGSGKTFGDIQQNDTKANSVALQVDNKIVISGETLTGSNLDFALIRLNTDATLDTTFGLSGKVITDFQNGTDGAQSVVIQPDGKILAAGYAGIGLFKIALARYLSGLNIGIVEFSERNSALLIYPNPSGTVPNCNSSSTVQK